MFSIPNFLSAALTACLIVGIMYGALHWLVNVRSQLSEHTAQIREIRNWIAMHEKMIQRQIELFNQLRNDMAGLAVEIRNAVERLDRISKRIYDSERSGK